MNCNQCASLLPGIDSIRLIKRYLRGVALVSILSMSSGCLTYTYEEYGSRQADKYFGTQPGYHQLSDYFDVEVQDYLLTFYYRDPVTQSRRQLGIIQAPWFDRSDYGPREMAYAVSVDGRRLLYFDEPGAQEGDPLRIHNGVVVADLYSFDAVSGQSVLLHGNVHRRAFGCLELPRNYITFGVVHTIANIEVFVRSTEGSETSLNVRRRDLLANGDEERICGPL